MFEEKFYWNLKINFASMVCHNCFYQQHQLVKCYKTYKSENDPTHFARDRHFLQIMLLWQMYVILPENGNKVDFIV